MLFWMVTSCFIKLNCTKKEKESRNNNYKKKKKIEALMKTEENENN